MTAWYARQTEVVKALIVSLLSVLLAQVPPQLLEDLRPALPKGTQEKVDKAAALADEFGIAPAAKR